MPLRPYILASIAGALLAGCAAAPSEPHTSYGPANIPSMAPNTGMQNFHGMNGWGANDENLHPATPPAFKGY
jgi:hypothetical protein